jgi:predicted HNH restriction endonuclease
MIISKLYKMPLEELQAIISGSTHISEAVSNLGYKTKCQSIINLIRKVCLERGVSTDHFLSFPEIISLQRKKKSRSLVEGWLKGEIQGHYDTGNFDLKDPVRDWVLERAGNKCEKCGWNMVNEFTKNIPVQVHHEDGNAANSRPENLKVLCPNCHSLTKNFGRRNISVRTYRYGPKAKLA